MSKVGRNETCPCGSGKKYKKCCIVKEVRNFAIKASPFFDFMETEEDQLTRDSNWVVDLIDEGRLDEAETAARELLINYPEVNDGFERLAWIYEKRGDKDQAISMYQKALDFTLASDVKDNYDEEIRDYYRERISIVLNKK